MFYMKFNRQNEYSHPTNDFQKIVSKLSPYAVPDKSSYLVKERALFVQCVNFASIRSHHNPEPYYNIDADTVVVSWSRLDNRSELAPLLNLSFDDLERFSDSEVIFNAWMKWGAQCAEYLVGDYSFAIYSIRNQTVFCARDHMGARPFYYYISNQTFVCSTSIPPLLSCKDVHIALEEDWIANYLSNLSMDYTRTPYCGIYKLAPAHQITVDLHKHVLRQYYHLTMFNPLILKDSSEYVELYRNQLDTAVTSRLSSNYPVGCELSGGIDSSTIASIAAKNINLNDNNLHAFAFANLELESQYIQAVCQKSMISAVHVLTGPTQYSESLHKRSLDILGYPIEHDSASYHEPFYVLAEKLNIRVLLSGFGGDEFVTTLHGNLVLRELITNKQYSELHSRLVGNKLFRLLRLIKLKYSELLTSKFSIPEYNPRFYNAFKKRWEHQIVRDSLTERYDLRQRYIDKARFDAGYTDLKKFTLEKRWQPFIPTRMENCILMAASRKIEYSWPLLDIRLIKLFMSIPSKEHYYRGMNRYLHRRAINGIVPDIITWKPTKDMGRLVGFTESQSSQTELVNISELHPELVKIINVDKLSNQIQRISAKDIPQNSQDLHFQFQKNILAVSRVDHWLKHQFS